MFDVYNLMHVEKNIHHETITRICAIYMSILSKSVLPPALFIIIIWW